ncbi:3-(methylthio)propionyl-CoA ligase [Oceanibacterium hippocampi]|uniref:3-methylmercaptopropionyl-CoA ligase n=1 Tax=Oceanibacterium hippocampi TaxID=745714 RepID=A0A1Y5TXA2_9PROT|nr:3-(methylthio)propionyl-CoA ligase [Oceanibacterium hippocampi]SLN72807.1 Long-chain-fatty-acid--CoA ligase [Oceanibacterium hippocampi]
MLGLIQDRPLLIHSLIDFAAEFHGDVEIVSRTVEGPIHRCTYRDLASRSKRVARMLDRLGVALGDRIGTLAWNGYRHMELYFGVSGMGAVLHTLNPRLFPEQITYIANHAEDKYIFFDLTFAPLIEALADHLPNVKGFVAMTDAAHMPDIKVDRLHCYETLLEAETDDYEWPSFDERTASSLCYTSGTTGNPKGVLYSHRSTVLHSWAVCTMDGLALSSHDVVLPVVPMFHANAWGLPYAAAMCGAKMVMPGARLDGESVYELLETENVTLSAGVPTVWLMLLGHVKAKGLKFSTMNRTVIGGSAAPRSMIETFQRDYGVDVIHAWGMTEMSPLGTTGNLRAKHAALPFDKQIDVRVKQGRAIFGVDLKIVDDDGKELPHDGKAFGHLLVRGPWITNGYFKGEGGKILDDEDFFDTGDVATLDPDGYMQITDRSKDVIKSGGEWISSIDVENEAVGCPGIAEAAVIAVPHPKWAERPLMIAVRKPDADVTKEAVLDHLTRHIAKWQLPDDIVFVDELPHTATGKLLKTKLREQFKDYKLPTA